MAEETKIPLRAASAPRTVPNTGSFSSEEGRQLLERELLLAGMHIRSLSQNPSPALRPLGLSPFRHRLRFDDRHLSQLPEQHATPPFGGAIRRPTRPILLLVGTRSCSAGRTRAEEVSVASTRAAHRRDQIRRYDRSTSVVFLKTKEAFGGLSNMASGFPLVVNGVRIRTSEALYQACRFPHLPDLQRTIVAQRSPMTAKMKGKPYRHDSRQRLERGARQRHAVVPARQAGAELGRLQCKLLLDTGEPGDCRAISERTTSGGAKPVDHRTLVGMNVLGRLLMELERVPSRPNLQRTFSEWNHSA